MLEIIDELNLENGSKHKINVLKKHIDNELLKRVLKMTYDGVIYDYGVGMKTIDKIVIDNPNNIFSLEEALDILEEEFVTRKVTGNAALERLSFVFNSVPTDIKNLLIKIIDGDLKINIGKTQINKVFKGLITKPSYCRCDTYNEKTAKNISFPAYVQLKADGTYREFFVKNGIVTSRSRSGEPYEYPLIFEEMKSYPEGVYTGELTVQGISDRAEGNGLINSDNPPHDKIKVELWDFITHDEYKLAAEKDKKNPCVAPYSTRWDILSGIVKGTSKIHLIPCKIVNSIQEALQITSEWMNAGYEGAILKDFKMVFKDGTSKHQLKLKLEIDVEVRCTGFLEGKKGTKREKTFGSIMFENDEGTIKGRCSGFTDAQLEDFNNRREELIGKIFTVQFNDLTKAENNDYYALSHPRFIEFRDDKDETDTLEKAFKMREMAMSLS
jgi:hypothetical protein